MEKTLTYVSHVANRALAVTDTQKQPRIVSLDSDRGRKIAVKDAAGSTPTAVRLEPGLDTLGRFWIQHGRWAGCEARPLDVLLFAHRILHRASK